MSQYPYNRDLQLSMSSDPDERVEQTLAAMKGFVRGEVAKNGTAVNLLARTFNAQVGKSLDPTAYALRYGRLVYAFLRDCVAFKPDPIGTELVRLPDQLLAEISAEGRALADCDDVATLGASLLAAGCVKPCFVVMTRTPNTPYEHVFFGAVIDQDGPLTPSNVTPYDPQERVAPGRWPSPTPARLAIRPAW